MTVISRRRRMLTMLLRRLASGVRCGGTYPDSCRFDMVMWLAGQLIFGNEMVGVRRMVT